MSVKGFDVLVINGEIDFTIRNITPLTIGAGKKPLDPIAPDIPLLLDSTGRPVIPGSTLKGFFRGNIERALLAYGVASASQILEDIFGKSVGEAWGSHMFFTDAYVEGEYKIMSRQHIMINPRTQGVQHGPFEQEYVVENTLFRSKIYFRNMPLSLLSLLELAVNLANLGIARLGRSKSRGYGQITIDMNNVKVLLKSATTIMMDNDEIWLDISGNDGLSTGGSGDVLSGIIEGQISEFILHTNKNCSGTIDLNIPDDTAISNGNGIPPYTVIL